MRDSGRKASIFQELFLELVIFYTPFTNLLKYINSLRCEFKVIYLKAATNMLYFNG